MGSKAVHFQPTPRPSDTSLRRTEIGIHIHRKARPFSASKIVGPAIERPNDAFAAQELVLSCCKRKPQASLLHWSVCEGVEDSSLLILRAGSHHLNRTTSSGLEGKLP